MTTETRPLSVPQDIHPPDAAEVFVAQLVAAGVEFIFINSGTDTFPIQEAIAKRIALGLRAPRVVLCLDEMVTAAAAQGYFQVTGQPQMCLVHVDVGTLQFGGAVHNAQRDRAGMLLCAGRAPATIDDGLPGGRSSAIHWIQEQLDQNGILRNYTKWDYELRRKENVAQVVQRGLQVAASEPAGPVYLSLPRELLLEEVNEVVAAPPHRFAPVPAPAARPELIQQAADLLSGARSPLIICGHAGRHPEAVASIVKLAEHLGCPVYADGTRLSIPTTHPLFSGSDATAAVPDSDVLLCLDIDVPYIPERGKLRPDAQVIVIHPDPVNASFPLLGFPVDVAIHADAVLAYEALANAVISKVPANADRRARTAAVIEEQRNRWREQVARSQGISPMSPDVFYAVLGEMLDDTWIVNDESVGNSPLVSRFIPRDVPGTLFKSGGSSLGWALGASLGMKLARPEMNVVAIVGDGTFVYGCPTAALWASDIERAPFLTIVVNNKMHNATRNSHRQAYPKSYADRIERLPGAHIDPPPDFAALARALRAHGETVHTPDEIRPALERAMEAVKHGQSAVLDVFVNLSRAAH